MRIIILCIIATYTLTGCREEKKSAAAPPTEPSTPAPAAAQPAQKSTNFIKAPLDRTRNVLDQVKKANAGNE